MNLAEITLYSLAAGIGAWWFGFGWEAIPLCFLLGVVAGGIVTGVRLIFEEGK